MNTQMEYDIKAHCHRFSTWAAVRAAQRGFAKANVVVLREALEVCGVVKYLDSENWDDPKNFDKRQCRWCKRIIAFLEKKGVPNFSFGRAAKLIAIYLKVVVVLGARSGTALARIVHPPIDSILLKNLSNTPEMVSEHKREWKRISWTKLNETQYKKLIEQLRKISLPEKPFWMIERFWTVTNDVGVEPEI